jgi:hypothetical protein
VAYASDHQMPQDSSFAIPDGVMELADGADLLIHDAQYTPDEFAAKAHWGHCTVDYAVHVAREAGVRRLALFHHDPDHDDETLDRLLDEARSQAEKATERAREEINAEKERAMAELRAQVADLALDAAAKLVRSDMNATTQRRLVEEFLAEAEPSRPGRS